MTMTSVPIRYRRAERGQFFQKLQHAIPSVVVLGDGLSHLSNDPHGIELILGVAEVGVSLAVIFTVIRGFQKLAARRSTPAQQHHHGVDWIDICIGLMLGVEAYAKYHETHHVPRPTVLLAVAMLAVGLLHGRIAAWGSKRRHLRVTADHISFPRRPFFRTTLTWPEVASIDIGDRYATVTATNGRSHRFDLSDLIDATGIRDALMQARTFLDESRHAASASIESTTTSA